MSTRTKRQAFGLQILNSNHPEIRRLKRDGHQAEIHGNKFWNSSYLLMDHLRRHPPRKGTRVLEIGCGWGLLGIFCAKTFGCKPYGTDADANVFPYLTLHAQINGVDMPVQRLRFEHLTRQFLSNFDLILGADICFWDDMAGELFNLVNRARLAGVGQVMISDPCRPPFDDLTERCEDRYGDAVEVVEKFLSRPVNASGEILVVDFR